jgi:GNAT superfamily N-acetyltransferase
VVKVGLNKSIKLRLAKIIDLENIACLHAQSWQENYNEVLSVDYLANKVVADRMVLWTTRLTSPEANQAVFVAEHGQVFVGFICLFAENHQTYGTIIDNLHVKASYKGKGVGTLLLNTAAQWANKAYPEIGLYLEVLACNSKAMGFYSSLGAINTTSGYWHTPCDSKVKEFVYCWSSAKMLMAEIMSK